MYLVFLDTAFVISQLHIKISINFIFTIVNTTPSLKDLAELITLQYAVNWKLIGTLLGLSNNTLEIIEAENKKVTDCCNKMFSVWLDTHIDASWKKLLSAIETLHKGE